MNRQSRNKSKASRTSAMKQVQGTARRVSQVPDNRKPANLEKLVTQLLTVLGEDPKRSGLEETPKRVAKALSFFTKGYQQNVDDLVSGALFPIEYDEMVIVRDIDLFSLCEHHMLPFFGKCHVGYIPGKRVVGLLSLIHI